MRVIHLPAVNKTVSIKSYVLAVKLAKANPNMEFKHGLSSWWPTKGREIVRQFRDGMTDRINQAMPYIKRGVQAESKAK